MSNLSSFQRESQGNFYRCLKKIISYDPNFRQSLWDDRLSAKKQIEKGLYYTDILKLSEEEHYLLTKTNEFKEGSNLLNEKYGINLIFVTVGNKGCFFRFNDETGVVPIYQVNVVDTTAAGDSFLVLLFIRYQAC
ncbi:PfkB family carbohydrate kinase [Pseudogracilibacillus sp. SO30301A]|uniref:PfkB family carbohydrate kinase n=1 Tax=Pseudogracilibacillus sp. SO30301A TaxID=3098291 RepID=UPI003FA6EB3B